jgi:sRNA-binding protein
MDVSEDGTVTGSIDVNQLNEIDPKTDEAKAQIEALKADAAAAQEQANADAEARGVSTAPAESKSDESKAEAKSDDKAPAKKAAASHSSTDRG